MRVSHALNITSDTPTIKPPKPHVPNPQRVQTITLSPTTYGLLKSHAIEFGTKRASVLRLALLDYMEQPLELRRQAKPTHALRKAMRTCPLPDRSRILSFKLKNQDELNAANLCADEEGITRSAVLRRALYCYLTNAFGNADVPPITDLNAIYDFWGDMETK